MLIGTGAQIQFNGATGNAAFAGGLAIGINDNGDNKYWVSGVTKYYKELGGK